MHTQNYSHCRTHVCPQYSMFLIDPMPCICYLSTRNPSLCSVTSLFPTYPSSSAPATIGSLLDAGNGLSWSPCFHHCFPKDWLHFFHANQNLVLPIFHLISFHLPTVPIHSGLSLALKTLGVLLGGLRLSHIFFLPGILALRSSQGNSLSFRSQANFTASESSHHHRIIPFPYSGYFSKNISNSDELLYLYIYCLSLPQGKEWGLVFNNLQSLA